MKMWHLIKIDKQGEHDAVVFDEECIKDYLEDGWSKSGTYEVTHLEGADILPGDSIESK